MSKEDKTEPNFTVKDETVSHESEISKFSSLLMSLATQTMMLLGDTPAPEGIPLKVDIAGARDTIDIIECLEQKTKGNLDSFEDSLIKDILHSLRISFLRHVKK